MGALAVHSLAVAFLAPPLGWIAPSRTSRAAVWPRMDAYRGEHNAIDAQATIDSSSTGQEFLDGPGTMGGEAARKWYPRSGMGSKIESCTRNDATTRTLTSGNADALATVDSMTSGQDFLQGPGTMGGQVAKRWQLIGPGYAASRPAPYNGCMPAPSPPPMADRKSVV